MITDEEVVRAPGLMGRVMVEETPVQDLMVIRADITIRTIRITREVTISNNSSRVIRATRSN